MTAVLSPQGAINYSYNAAGQRSDVTLPDNRTVQYGYDSGGRLNRITDWTGGVQQIGYTVDGVPSSVAAAQRCDQQLRL
ncbi:MAG: RHS repeat domain-containing protein [Caldilineaceae bacterium]